MLQPRQEERWRREERRSLRAVAPTSGYTQWWAIIGSSLSVIFIVMSVQFLGPSVTPMFRNAYDTNAILGNLCESQEHCVYVLSIFYFAMETLAAFLIGFAIHAGIDLITGPSRQKRRTQARHQGDLLNPEV